MLHKAFGTPKKQKNNKKLKKHFLGKIFNFDLKKTASTDKRFRSNSQQKPDKTNSDKFYFFEKAKNVKRTTITNLLSCQTLLKPLKLKKI